MTMPKPDPQDLSALRRQMIAGRLAALEPSELEINDESAAHRGHEGARDGRSHFAVRIRAPCFAALSLIARHRLVNDAIGDLFQTDIHALRIDAAP